MFYTTSLTSIALLLLLTACAAPEVIRNETINELIIFNQTRNALTDVKLSVPKTRSFISCNVILPRAECSLVFRELENKRNPATLSWTQNGKTYARDIVPDIPENLDKDKPAKVILTIGNDGEINSKIRQ